MSLPKLPDTQSHGVRGDRHRIRGDTVAEEGQSRPMWYVAMSLSRILARVDRVLALALMLAMVLAAGCGLPNDGTISQGGGLPDLYPLDWGYRYYDTPSWSPNGKWIALEAGSGVADSHLVVVSPDGRFRRDLRNWNCGHAEGFDIAWLPGSMLSCVNNTQLLIGAYPFTAPQRFMLSDRLLTQADGAVWNRSSENLLIVSSDPPGGSGDNGQLYVVARDGSIAVKALTPSSTYVQSPAWGQGIFATSLTYEVSENDQHLAFDLVLSAVTFRNFVPVALGPLTLLARDVDQFYAWSPSGHWIAVRHADPHGGDRIYLLDPANPSHTVDVVLADKAGVQMADPISSPDGQTLIVFSVGYDTSTPYELDIGAYLKGKGLQP